jgi:CLIP-associating protein 1/2
MDLTPTSLTGHRATADRPKDPATSKKPLPGRNSVPMTKKDLTEDDVQTFLVKLKAAGTSFGRLVINWRVDVLDADKKVDQIQFFGLKLEDASSVRMPMHRVSMVAYRQLPEVTLDAMTQSLAPLLKANSQLLVMSTMSHFLTLYIPLLPLSPARHLQLVLVQLLPALLEKMNDPKERIHSAAAVCVSMLGKRCYEAEGTQHLASSAMSVKGKEKEGLAGTWERSLKEVLGGKGSRGKLEAIKLLTSMRAVEASRVPLKPWLAPLVDLLEDGDGPVREQAREVSSNLYR